MPKLIIAARKKTAQIAAPVQGQISFDGETLTIQNQDGILDLPLTPEQKSLVSKEWQHLSFQMQRPWTREQYEFSETYAQNTKKEKHGIS